VVPREGDPLGAEGPYFGDSGVSIQATWYNAGKSILALDSRSPRDRVPVLELVASADILIHDWPPGGPAFPPEELRAWNPRLVEVAVTPMGDEGPWAGLVTNDLIANALCGSASVTGSLETPPLNGYGNQSHHTVGMYAAICSLAALRAARSTRQPIRVDLSAHEALVSCTEQVLMQWFFEGNWPTRVAQRQGSLHWSGAYEVYPSATGQESWSRPRSGSRTCSYRG
jgi:crotonobetainyl-CoA:carnitine CoA-transferase CaiB-like acyl-CoA transferase